MFGTNLEPQFFDLFGAIGFIYIIVLSLLGLFGRRLPRWMFAILFSIGIIGLFVDTLVVYTFYIE